MENVSLIVRSSGGRAVQQTWPARLRLCCRIFAAFSDECDSESSHHEFFGGIPGTLLSNGTYFHETVDGQKQTRVFVQETSNAFVENQLKDEGNPSSSTDFFVSFQREKSQNASLLKKL